MTTQPATTSPAGADELRDAALAYAAGGVPVFPCEARGKRPLTTNGFKDATADAATITAWWERFPQANIGIPTGTPSGWLVVDLDTKNGVDGVLAFRQLLAGRDPLPRAPRARTGSGGYHLLFSAVDGLGSRTNVRPGMDLRGQGGYIIAPPSIHPNGTAYSWELEPAVVPPPALPAWLVDVLQVRDNPEPSRRLSLATEQRIPQGERNERLFRIAASLRGRGLTTEAIRAALLEENRQRCDPPLPEKEVERIAGSIDRYPEGDTTKPTKGAFVGFEGRPEAPLPIPNPLAAVPAFSLDLLPQAFASWVGDIAERMQCPPDFPAVGAVVALAAVVGRQVGIRPKRKDDWTVVPNLWGAVVGRPGLLKSPALAEVLRPLDRLECLAKEAHEVAVQEHEARVLVGEQATKQAKDEIRKALKDGNDALARKVAAAVVNDDGAPPMRCRYKTNDTTVEKLGELLVASPRGILVFRDELVGLLQGLDKDGQEGARSFYLEAWSGTGRFTYDRVGRGTIDIPAACVSILGGIQPGPLSAYLRSALQGGVGDDGLLQRFQVTVWPDPSGEWRNVDRWPDSEAKAKAWEVFDRLDRLDALALGAEDSKDGIPFLRFAPAAQDAFDAWRVGLERRLRDGRDHPAFEAHLAKYRSLVPSIALLLHLADRCTGPVGEIPMLQALSWAEYLEVHARRLYAPAIDPALYAALELDRHVLRGDLPEPFRARDVYLKGWHLLDRDGTAAALVYLCELGRLIPSPVDTGGRPTVEYRLHPVLRKGGTE